MSDRLMLNSMSSTSEQMQTTEWVDIELARMTEHDLLEVVEIEEQSGLSRWGWSAYYAELQSRNRSLMLVARLRRPLEHPDSYNLAGYVVARVTAGELHINNVAVRDAFRRRGIGAALLSRILQEGRELGGMTAFLEVRSSNVAAQALYKKCGFNPVANRRNYYTEPPEDALVMSAELKG
jgi:ribosomal-protein-alanine N-acetyltransferase